MIVYYVLYLCMHCNPFPAACQDFNLRLSNQTASTEQGIYEGNVDVCLNGTYVAVCDLGWSDVEAQVACNILGYLEPFYRELSWCVCTCTPHLYRPILCLSGGTALRGVVPTVPIGIEDLTCLPNATTLAECQTVYPPVSLQCVGQSSLAAGVRCSQALGKYSHIIDTLYMR